MIKALAVVAFFAVSTQAIAECLSHNPYDPQCTMADFISPIGTVQWFLNNSVERAGDTDTSARRARFPPPRHGARTLRSRPRSRHGGR